MPTNKNRPNSDSVFTKYEVISATENTPTESAGLGTQSDKIHNSTTFLCSSAVFILETVLKLLLRSFQSVFFIFLTHPEPSF
jgi:hypothetical protein